VVGSTSPTSTPRCPSPHCTAPGKGLMALRRGPQRRRRVADRDLRRAARGVAQRQARVTERVTRGTSPAQQRRPPGHVLGGDLPRADPATDRRYGLLRDRPERERHRDRGVAVVPARRHPTWDDRQDRRAARAYVAPARDHDPRRRAVRVGRTAELAIAEPVTVQPDQPTGGLARGTAVDAGAGPGIRHRGWRCKPPLDVERVMNDSWSASGRLLHRWRPGARRRRCVSTVGVTYFRRAPRSDPDGRRTLLHQPAGPRPVTVDDGDRSAEHQPAGSETRPRTSEEMLPNRCSRTPAWPRSAKHLQQVHEAHATREFGHHIVSAGGYVTSGEGRTRRCWQRGRACLGNAERDRFRVGGA
jgi:hypothetical protein